jgi:uncharacterized Zn finger protein
MTALVFPRQPHRRASRKLRSWWGRAFWRAVEEIAADETQLVHARSLARSGRIGGLVVDTGRFAAGVAEEAGVWTVTGAVPLLDEDGRAAFLEVVVGQADALLDGDLPHDLVEHAEEAGVELIPYGVELATTCSCPGWQRASRHGGVCEHAIAVLAQVTDLLDRDPLVLLQLRGISRDDLRPHRAVVPEPTRPDAAPDPVQVEVEIAVDAALRAAQLLAEAGEDCAPGGMRDPADEVG